MEDCISNSPMLQLSPELVQNIASFMDPNYAAFYFKLVCKEVAAALREQYRTIQLRGEPRVLQSPSDRRRWTVATAAQPWPGAAFVAHWCRPEPWRALPRWLRHRLLCLAASSHHPPSLDAALAHCGTVLQADALASAIMAGDLETCQRLYENEGCDWDDQLIPAAAGLSGSLPMCEWLVGTIPHCELTLLPEMLYAGHSCMVDWALARADKFRFSTGSDWLEAAVAGGRLELMQRLAVRYPLNLQAQRGEPNMLARVASSCPLAALQQYYEPWGTGLLEGIGPKLRLLLAAAGSPTPDWAAKCDWLWARWGAASAAVLGAYNSPLDGIAAVMQHTDFQQRLQLLASRGMGPCLERYAPRAAGAIGSTAAVEFCLDQLPALLRQHAAAPVAAAGGVGPAAAAAGGPLPAEDLEAQKQKQLKINVFMALIALASAEHGHVAVLRLLRVRGYVFRARHLRAALRDTLWHGCNETSGLASVRYLLLEGAADPAQGGVGAAADWSCLLRGAAAKGADLSLLRHLHEQIGVSINLGAVAQGGGEDALSWAVAALEAAGQAPEPLSCRAFHQVLSSGNWAAADWLVRHELALPKLELLRHMLLGDPKKTRIPELQWVVGMGGGQERVQGPAQLQWTAELHAALVRMQHNYGIVLATPCRQQWLTQLEEAVAVELAATAGEAPGAGQQG